MSLFKVVEVSKSTLQNVITYSTASGNAVLTKLTYFIGNNKAKSASHLLSNQDVDFKWPEINLKACNLIYLFL